MAPRVIAIVFNPISGSGRARAAAEGLKAALENLGAAVVLIPSEVGSAEQWLRPRMVGVHALVIVGGDGAVRAAAAVAAAAAVPLWHAPAGTENLFARSFGMTLDAEAIARALDAGSVRHIDLGVVMAGSAVTAVTAVTAAGSAVTAVASTVTAVESAVTAAGSAVTAVTPAVTAVTPAVTAVTPAVTAVASTVTAVTPAVTAAGSAVTAVASTVTAVPPAVTAVASAVTAVPPAVTAVASTVTAAEPAVTAAHPPAFVRETFTLMGSIGFDADVVHALARRRRGGISHASYLAPIWKALLNWQPPLLAWTIDGRREELGRGVAVVANLPRYALSLNPAADASAEDGLLDAVFIPARSALELLPWVALLRFGLHRRVRRLRSRRGSEVTLHTDLPCLFQLDGDPAGSGERWSEVRFTVQPRTLPILHPVTVSKSSAQKVT